MVIELTDFYIDIIIYLQNNFQSVSLGRINKGAYDDPSTYIVIPRTTHLRIHD